ncbi:MAG: DUF11 domain-containing protein, partial [Methylococcales bacterium]|nr:DUF11 domain-containing protein [Methylococcales bacterium]
MSDTGTDQDGDPTVDPTTEVTDPEDTETDNPLDVNPNTDDPADDPTTLLIEQMPSLSLIKSASEIEDTNGDGVTNAGDTVLFTFSVENTGNVTLTDVTISDDLVSVMGGPIASLAAGDIDDTTFTASYVLEVADINAGGVENTALVTGTPPALPDGTQPDDVVDTSDTGTDQGGDPTVDPSTTVPDPEGTETDNPLGVNPNTGDTGDDPTTVLIEPMPGLSVIKSVSSFDDANADGFANVGETVNYSFTVTNTGNVSLTNVTITDALVAIAGGPIVNLDPGITDTTTFTASYDLTQD